MKKGMIKVTVFYPGGEGKTFDMDYYCNKHMAAVRSMLGEALKGMAAEKGLAGGAPDAPAPFMVIGSMYFESLEAVQLLQSKGAQLMADIPNFTNSEPVMQISEIMV